MSIYPVDCKFLFIKQNSMCWNYDETFLHIGKLHTKKYRGRHLFTSSLDIN